MMMKGIFPALVRPHGSLHISSAGWEGSFRFHATDSRRHRFYFIELKYTVKARIRFLSQWMISDKSGNRKAMAVFVSVAFFRALIL